MSRLNFAEYNFDNLVSQLKAVVQAEDAWKDINIQSGTGAFLIELFSYIAEMLMYYLERRAQEGYIDTAQIRSSVVRLVSLLGYKPKRKTSATGYLKFWLAGGHITKDIYIPKKTLVTTAAGIKFSVKEGGVIYAGQNEVYLKTVQGEYIEEPVTSTGIPNLEIVVENDLAEDSHIQVLVDGALWTEKANFVDSDAESEHYVQSTTLDGYLKITFGDGKFGKIPELNKAIVIEYVETDGKDGNVYSIDQITTLQSILYDEDGTDRTSLVSVTNISATGSANFLGGDDAEDKDEIRREAPLVFKTGQRAVTRADFITILENIGGVMTAYVWGERDIVPDYASADITMLNKLKVSMLLQDWQNPDNAFKALVVGEIAKKEQLTVWLEFVDATVIDLIVDLEIKVLASHETSQVISDVGALLDTALALGTVKLGIPVRHSDLVGMIENVIGVDYCHLVLNLEEVLGVGDGFAVTFEETMHLTELKTGTVKIYKDGVLQAHDDALGGFVNDVPNALDLGLSVVTYATGLVHVVFQVAPLLDEEITCVYEQDEEGDLVVGYDEIVKLVEKNITAL